MLYTTVLHDVRRRLDLSCNEYCVADIIYKLSSNPGAPVTGWCNQSRKNMAEEMGLSRRTIIDIINALIEKNLVQKNDVDYVRTTQKWYDATTSAQAEIEAKREQKGGGAESAHPVQKVHTPTSAESAQGGGAESAHNNKSIDNKINNTNERSVDKPREPLPKSSVVLPFDEAKPLLETHRTQLLGAAISKETDCKNLRISTGYYDHLVNAFFDKQIRDAERQEPLEYYRVKAHFDNWIKVQVNLGEQSDHHPQHVNVKPAFTQTPIQSRFAKQTFAPTAHVFNELN